jgi:hypothetical protein
MIHQRREWGPSEGIASSEILESLVKATMIFREFGLQIFRGEEIEVGGDC